MRMGSSLHHLVEPTMQTTRSNLEILPSKHMLLSPGRDAHICQRPSGFRYNNVPPSAKNHLEFTD